MKRLIMAAALLVATGGAWAADEPGGGHGACRADVEKLCKGVEPGQGRIAECMKQHEAQVSGECKAQMQKMHAEMESRMQAFNAACKADAEQHCKGVEPGKGRMVACLRKNEANLSAGCKEQMAKMDERREQAHERMSQAREACKGDAKQLCADVKPGEGRMMRCLKDNEAKLSAGCKAALQPKG
jgi:Golgi apparatus protein 1